MTDLNELQIFVHLAQTRSFTAAARILALPKSSVSRSLARLETRLGVRLVERTTRHVNLTEEGRIYFDRCERVIEEAEQAEIEIGVLRARPRGTLRVGAPGIFARAILGPALSEFLSMYPDVRVNLHQLDSIPRDRVLDVMIRPGPLEDSGLMERESPSLFSQFRARIEVASPTYDVGNSSSDEKVQARRAAPTVQFLPLFFAA